MSPRNWLPLLILMFLAGVFIRSPLLITFSVILILLVSTAEWWRRHALEGVFYRRRLRYRRSFPGEKTPLRIEVENRKLLPVSWLKIADAWPKAVGPENLDDLAPSHIAQQGFLTNLFSLRWFERTSRSYTLLSRQRGIYPVGPATLESGDLFGLFTSTRELPSGDVLTVFPEILPLSELKLEAEDPFGERRTRRQLYEDPNLPMGVRDYQPEDGFRRIHWPATARVGAPQSKVYQPVSARVLMVCLNVSTLERYWEGVLPDLLERLVKVAASLLYHAYETGYAVGLLSNGCLAHSDQPFRLPPGRSGEHLAATLSLLAGVTPFTTGPFARYLMRSMPEVPFGATVVVVTAVVPAELNETLVSLKRYRRNITLVSLAATPPREIPGIRNVHLPFRP